MNKNYFIKNFTTGKDGGPELVYLHDGEAVLLYVDEYKEDKISIYKCECIVDWS